MKVLLVNYERISGVEYYRSIKPSMVLTRLYPEYEFTTVQYIHPTEDLKPVSIEETQKKILEHSQSNLVKPNDKETELIDDNFLKSFDLIIFTRELGFHEHIQGIADRLRRLGIPFGVDTDDYWILPDNHLIAEEYKRMNRSWAIAESMRLADFVITTTPILAKEIQEINKNVYVIENGLDLEDSTWQIEYTKSDLIRFGLMLGSTHYHDLAKAAPSINNMLRSNNDGYQICLGGFNVEKIEKKGVNVFRSVHVAFEKLITDNYNAIPKSYFNYLRTFTKESNELYASHKYFRLWSSPVEEWGHQYKNIDISIVPLVDNKFNNCKSELKMIEAGFKGKAVIVSNVAPYNLLATDKNAYLVNSSREFYDCMKRALNNPNEVGDKIFQLREDVLKKYSLQDLSLKRNELYKRYK
jgi:processive 1,2-diacylglycerol beta-glucosyltransferase